MWARNDGEKVREARVEDSYSLMKEVEGENRRRREEDKKIGNTRGVVTMMVRGARWVCDVFS